jgi:hypothetical protein
MCRMGSRKSRWFSATAPERHGGQRREQQELEDPDERDNDAAFIHRGTLGVTGDGVDPAGRS